MIKILFVCHGNICRSTMAQFLFIHIAKQEGFKVVNHPDKSGDLYVDSAGTSTEELGNPVDRRTAAKLKEHGIACGTHFARQISRPDYDFYDYIILMDQENEWGLRRIIPNDPEQKIHMMLEFASEPEFKRADGSARDVADPWYTHDFEKTFDDLMAGCTGLLEYIAVL